MPGCIDKTSMGFRGRKTLFTSFLCLQEYYDQFKVAFQEQMNIREGRPSMFAGSRDVRAPVVINDRFLQQVFSATMPGGRTARSVNGAPVPRTLTGIIGYVINVVFQYCYSTISSILNLFIGGNEERSKLVI